MAEPIHASCTPQILTIHISMILGSNLSACHACQQLEKPLKGPKRQKEFCGFADVCHNTINLSILARTKMHIFVYTKVASSSEFKCKSNALIFSLIGHELSELREIYKMCLEMEIFHGMPLVLQTAVMGIQY